MQKQKRFWLMGLGLIAVAGVGVMKWQANRLVTSSAPESAPKSLPRVMKSAEASTLLNAFGAAPMQNAYRSTPQIEIASANALTIERNQRVLFAGDSIMQGIAPFVQQGLKAKGVASINLAKASTGLTNAAFFDWPETIENALKQHSDIGLLVLLMGANDPQGIKSSATNRYHAFQTPEWDAEYTRRIERILKAAAQHRVKVLWLTQPQMGKADFSARVAHINQLYQRVLNGRATVLPLAAHLSDGQAYYVDAIEREGKRVHLRAPDRIHFTPTGAKYAAQYVQKAIIIK